MIIPSHVFHVKECSNSLDLAKLELDRVPDGTLFLADVHHKPRGRQGRMWYFSSGQLLLTFVLKPDLTHSFLRDQHRSLSVFQMAMTLAFLEPLRIYGVSVKWPNDFMIEKKKVAGFLSEVVWKADKLRGIVVGFGCNVYNRFDPSHELYDKATSLRDHTKVILDKDCLQEKICVSLSNYYTLWQRGEHKKILCGWRESQKCLGKNISVHMTSGILIKGICKGFSDDGSIMIEDRGVLQKIPFFMTSV